MENKTRSRVMLAITLFSAIVLSGTVFVCARRAGEEVTQRSFDELTTATKQLAKDINNATRTDQTILSAMAELIAGQDERDNDAVLRIMKSFSLNKTFVSTVALLLPDGTLLLTDGARYDVSDTFDFETEAARGDGAHIAADAVGDFFHRLLVGVALEHFAATQIREVAERVMPGIQQDVAVVAVHKKEEGIAVVEVDLIVSGKLLQEDDAVEDGDGLAVALHRRDVAHHQLFRRKVAFVKQRTANLSALGRKKQAFLRSFLRRTESKTQR